jgi:hypothetical protein
MPDSGFVTIEDRIERLEDKIEQLSDMVVRIAEDLESGFADVQKTSDQEFKQLRQAILFWGARARALEDRDGFRRRS